MALYVKDQEVDDLAHRLATLRNITKTEAVRQALQHELDRDQHAAGLIEKGLVEKGMAFVRDLNRRFPKHADRTADKAFIDSLYGDP